MKKLYKKGYICYRAPASGKKAKRVPYADVICVKKCSAGCKLLAFEVKYFEWWHTVFISEYQYSALKEFHDKGFEVYIAIKIGSEDFKFIPFERIQPHEPKTEGRSKYKWKVERDLYLEGLSLDQVSECNSG